MKKFIPAQLIKKKKYGGHHSEEELKFLVNEYTARRLPDYQMSAWLMAVCLKGMSDEETVLLTSAMKNSGQVLNFSHLPSPVVDKHSTGGVGDKTTLIVAPIAAAAGVPVAMVAGRGLGHTGGTLDKLKSMRGFSVAMSLSEFQAKVSQFGLAIMGQTEEICPADRLMYALRDVTGTVDSLPLICSSIMSKKLAEGVDGLVLDVKYGSGAFMKTIEEARRLSLLLKKIGSAHGLAVRILLTNMNQPLGQFIGNSLEVFEALEILRGKSSPLFADTKELSLEIAAHMIHLGRKSSSLREGRDRASRLLEEGHAYKVFKDLCLRQGALDIENLPHAPHVLELKAKHRGYIESMDTESIGLAAVLLEAGRTTLEDEIDYRTGIECLVKVGKKVERGDTLFKIHGRKDLPMKDVGLRLESSLAFFTSPPLAPNLIAETMTEGETRGRE
ncbi:MAG: thymidine phosphorylase [Bdellovibrionales bacterium]|nr:thymidine phosphorylase [Bdellovibrionales bacterium]